jgi:hypothetical protein
VDQAVDDIDEVVAGVDTTDTGNASGEVNDTTVGGVDTTDTGNASGEVNATSTVGDIEVVDSVGSDWGVPLTTLLVASLEIFKMLFKTFVTRFSINFQHSSSTECQQHL